MRNFTLKATLILSCLSWLSVGDCRTVNVQPGEHVTLLCSNLSNYDSVTFWFRLINDSSASCISVMFTSESNAEFCGGFQSDKYEMRTNITTVFLTIKQVDVSDSGLFFCEFYTNGRMLFHVSRLNVKGSSEPPHTYTSMESNNKNEHVISMTLGALTFFLVVVIIGLVVQNRKLKTAEKEEQNPEPSQNLSTEDMNYAAVTFRPKTKRREQPNIIYAATRQNQEPTGVNAVSYPCCVRAEVNVLI